MNLAQQINNLNDEQQLSWLGKVVPLAGEEAQAAALALRLGVPDLALRWALAGGDNALAAAAALRLGQLQVAHSLINTLPDDARRAVLLARAQALSGSRSPILAEQARGQARREGDAPALVAAVTLLGELQLHQVSAAPSAPKPYVALRTLAEGLKVAELTGKEADAHVLAVLAYAQKQIGSAAKAERTAQKALERAPLRSPAQIWALLTLERYAEAEAERQAGQLDVAWFYRQQGMNENAAHS